ncbi:MAG: glycosyltransferase [Chitinophagales bacterium]
MKFTVVIPCYQSTKALDNLVADILRQYNEACHEIILVQDGPDAQTSVRLQNIASSSAVIRVIQLEQNVGQHQATLCGLQHADSHVAAVIMDDDGQVQAQEIEKLLNKANQTGADITYGLYKERYHKGLRSGISRLFSKVISRYSNIPSQGSSFKLIAPRVLVKLKPFAAPFVYLDEVLAWYADSTVFTEVCHLPRKEGVSGYSWAKLLRLGWRIMLHYTTIPYRLLIYIGLGLSIGATSIFIKPFSQFGRLDSSLVDFSKTEWGILVLGLGMIAIGRIGVVRAKKEKESGTRGYQIKLK